MIRPRCGLNHHACLGPICKGSPIIQWPSQVLRPGGRRVCSGFRLKTAAPGSLLLVTNTRFSPVQPQVFEEGRNAFCWPYHAGAMHHAFEKARMNIPEDLGAA